MTAGDMIPVRNGAAGAKAFWLEVGKFGWPILVAVAMVTFYIGGRLETPVEKQDRIDRALRPIYAELERLEIHVNLGGHAKMEGRMDAVEARIRGIADTEIEETRILRDIADILKEANDLRRHKQGGAP